MGRMAGVAGLGILLLTCERLQVRISPSLSGFSVMKLQSVGPCEVALLSTGFVTQIRMTWGNSKWFLSSPSWKHEGVVLERTPGGETQGSVGVP
jgi:hypothetical protein